LSLNQDTSSSEHHPPSPRNVTTPPRPRERAPPSEHCAPLAGVPQLRRIFYHGTTGRPERLTKTFAVILWNCFIRRDRSDFSELRFAGMVFSTHTAIFLMACPQSSHSISRPPFCERRGNSGKPRNDSGGPPPPRLASPLPSHVPDARASLSSRPDADILLGTPASRAG